MFLGPGHPHPRGVGLQPLPGVGIGVEETTVTRAGVSKRALGQESGGSVLVVALPLNAWCITSLFRVQLPCLDRKAGCAYSGWNSEGKLGQQPPRARVVGEAALQESRHSQGRGQTGGGRGLALAPASAQGNRPEAQGQGRVLTAATAASRRHAAPHPLVGSPPLRSG